MLNNLYETVIGLEVHVELATKTKIFCNCDTSFGCPPNTNICPVCMGMPGALPVLNREVVNKAIAVGLATNCTIASRCKFDRKNYFYPDNPQNYQISQLYEPICKNGWLMVGDKKIGIHEIHMEEDAGKLIHSEDNETLVDYNRAGVPLIEIVTEPDMRNAEEVNIFLQKLKLCVEYLGASDCKLNEGSMRVDVNLSVRKQGEDRFGTRTEMKNLNSFRAISSAIEIERKRQIELIENSENVILETRRYDDENKCSYPMRSKEDSKDYRYYPEPDVPPVYIDEEWIEGLKKSMPEMQEAKKLRYKETFGLPDYDIDIITGNKKLADIFEATIGLGAEPKKVSNWLMGETLRIIKEFNLDEERLEIKPEKLAAIIRLIDKKIINGTTGKKVYEKVLVSGVDPEEYIESNNLKQVFDEDILIKTIEQVILDNPKSVEDYKGGKTKAIGFLVGQTMKSLSGKAAPSEVTRLLEERLRINIIR